jgi:hypothetical protein
MNGGGEGERKYKIGHFLLIINQILKLTLAGRHSHVCIYETFAGLMLSR